jgi:hypothetical protein
MLECLAISLLKSCLRRGQSSQPLLVGDNKAQLVAFVMTSSAGCPTKLWPDVC